MPHVRLFQDCERQRGANIVLRGTSVSTVVQALQYGWPRSFLDLGSRFSDGTSASRNNREPTCKKQVGHPGGDTDRSVRVEYLAVSEA